MIAEGRQAGDGHQFRMSHQHIQYPFEQDVRGSNNGLRQAILVNPLLTERRRTLAAEMITILVSGGQVSGGVGDGLLKSLLPLHGGRNSAHGAQQPNAGRLLHQQRVRQTQGTLQIFTDHRGKTFITHGPIDGDDRQTICQQTAIKFRGGRQH